MKLVVFKASSDQKDYPYNELQRNEQVVISRLHARHNTLKCHLFNTLQIRDTDGYNCGTGKMTDKYVLKEYPSYTAQGKLFWLTSVHLRTNYGDVDKFKLTSAFLKYIQVDSLRCYK